MFCNGALHVSCLDRMAYRLHAFYNDCSRFSLEGPLKEEPVGKVLWKSLSRRIKDGSFFVFSADLSGQMLEKALSPKGIKGHSELRRGTL